MYKRQSRFWNLGFGIQVVGIRGQLRRLAFFLKDSSLHGSRADFRHLKISACDMAANALRPDGLGFGCGRKPDVDGGAYHVTEALLAYGHVAEHHHAWEQRASSSAAGTRKNDTKKAYFNFANLGDFLGTLDGGALGPVVPVCYGGTFAVARERLLAVKPQVLSLIHI